jgi:phytoene desaturase
MTKVGIIGSGFSSLSSACYLAKSGYDVHLYEKNDTLGGRARQFETDGFVFDMGPSWYWMPDVFEKFFSDFGKSTSDYYDLVRLDPSYRVYLEDGPVDIPSGKEAFIAFCEGIEKGSGKKIRQFLEEAEVKYDTAMGAFVQKPSLKLGEFAHPGYMLKAVQLDMFQSFSKHVRKFTNNPKLLRLLEFPVLFLGAMPNNIPALYSMMNHADISMGTWYPMGGMHKIVEAMVDLAKSLGVTIHTSSEVSAIDVQNGEVDHLVINGEHIDLDVLVSGADYAHTEQQLLDAKHRKYDQKYWNSRTFAPSSLLYYIGLDTKVPELHHHNLFFDTDFEQHAREIYETHKWPENPLFYVSCPSKTDPSVAPEGKENMFILIPVSTEIEESDDIQDFYFNLVCDRLLDYIGLDIRKHVVYRRNFAGKDFKKDYHAFKGNAYGLANTLKQTAILKPKMKSKKVKNLYYTGQLTVPGPGVPPAIISGEVVSDLINKEHHITQAI